MNNRFGLVVAAMATAPARRQAKTLDLHPAPRTPTAASRLASAGRTAPHEPERIRSVMASEGDPRAALNALLDPDDKRLAIPCGLVDSPRPPDRAVRPVT